MVPSHKKLAFVDFIHDNDTIGPIISALEVFLGCPISVIEVPNNVSGPSTDLAVQLFAGSPDTHVFGFVCGSSYVLLSGGCESVEGLKSPALVDPISAPVSLQSACLGHALYYSDMVVRADSPYHTGADLRNTRFGYNDDVSWSGYFVVKNWLASLDEPETLDSFFKSARPSGGHACSLQAILNGDIDCAAIDCNVMHQLSDSERARLRVVKGCQLGPYPIQPVVISKLAPSHVRLAIQKALSLVHLPLDHADVIDTREQPLISRERDATLTDENYSRIMCDAREALANIFASRFQHVYPHHYDPIRLGITRAARVGCRRHAATNDGEPPQGEHAVSGTSRHVDSTGKRAVTSCVQDALRKCCQLEFARQQSKAIAVGGPDEPE